MFQLKLKTYKRTLLKPYITLEYAGRDSSYLKCSNCGAGCSACASGWIEVSNNCSRGRQYGYRKWRNCTTTCKKEKYLSNKVNILAKFRVYFLSKFKKKKQFGVSKIIL